MGSLARLACQTKGQIKCVIYCGYIVKMTRLSLDEFKAEEETRFGVAHFTHPMAGTVHFQTLNERQGLTTSIFSDIFHINQDRPAASDHTWKLFITDYASNAKGTYVLYKVYHFVCVCVSVF